jgi:hypothetical protein
MFIVIVIAVKLYIKYTMNCKQMQVTSERERAVIFYTSQVIQ